jgi:plastocyanin
MKTFRSLCVLPLAIVMVSCSENSSMGPSTSPTAVRNPAVDSAPSSRETGPVSRLATPLSATVQFGQANVGSGFPPTSGHDSSSHAVDNMVPRTVVIAKGGTVTFNTFGVHEVAIYAPGTEPKDIDTSKLKQMPANCPHPPGPGLLIDDDTNRIALYEQPCGGPRQVQHQFTEPGRYLVICAFLPHFEVQMWGWVIVNE